MAVEEINEGGKESGKLCGGERVKEQRRRKEKRKDGIIKFSKPHYDENEHTFPDVITKEC